MKNANIKVIAGAAVCTLPLAMKADFRPDIVHPEVTFSASEITTAESVMIYRGGSVDNGPVAWTEATVWKPTYPTYTQLPIKYSNWNAADNYSPDDGEGEYTVQYRLVDNNIDYADDWEAFNVVAVEIPSDC